MKAIIPRTQKDNNRRNGRCYNKQHVFVQCDFTKAADDFFTKHEIYNLNFKCKTWSKVQRSATIKTVQALKKIYPNPYTPKYSRKAGCYCGCSPGYIVEGLYTGEDTWVTVTAEAQELEEFVKSLAKFEDLLLKEIAEHNPV